MKVEVALSPHGLALKRETPDFGRDADFDCRLRQSPKLVRERAKMEIAYVNENIKRIHRSQEGNILSHVKISK
jgi:hypothetical protein